MFKRTTMEVNNMIQQRKKKKKGKREMEVQNTTMKEER
jgi:hypothetical protein